MKFQQNLNLLSFVFGQNDLFLFHFKSRTFYCVLYHAFTLHGSILMLVLTEGCQLR
jgi:hypothetical protein